MFDMKLSSEHKSWEDWVMMALGVAIMIAPPLGSDDIMSVIALNAIVTGFLIFTLAISEMQLPEVWVERLTFALGLWACLSPLLLGYAGGFAGLVHFAAGAIVMAMTAIEMRQDHPTPTGR